MAVRQRRAGREIPEGTSSPVPKATPVACSVDGDLPWRTAFLVLMLARCFSANENLIHDCDETFNYWEPLHYLLYGNGFQTWEYSAEFSLRSYLYLLLHSIILVPVKAVLGNGPLKVNVFYFLRYLLAGFSAASDAALVTAVSRLINRRLAAYALLLLCLCHGCFVASTSFLPSTFSMYGLTLATAFFLQRRFHVAVSVAAVGVVLGWPFSVLATLPLVLYSLAFGGFWKVFFAGVVGSIGTLIPSLLADRYFYGKWTFSVLNLVLYNTAGGGDSSLYGVESPFFYLRNLFNNFNFAFLASLLLPFVMIWVRKRGYKMLFVAVSPLYLWTGFMSLQPHKEERFLYIIYPILCVAGAAAIEALPDMLPLSLKRKAGKPSIFLQVVKWSRPLALTLILLLSYSRTRALLTNYGAPMRIYRHLPSLSPLTVDKESSSSVGTPIDKNSQKVVCVGSEWHRFPSSFFLSSSSYKLVFLDDGFRGLLPLPFDFDPSSQGTASSPSHFNNQNKYSSKQFLENEEACDFLVELNLKRENFSARGSNSSKWEIVYEEPFLDMERSPPLFRAFAIPGLSELYNTFGSYQLLKRKRVGEGEGEEESDRGRERVVEG